MKKFINIALVLFVALFVFSCRTDNDTVPVDVNDHDEIGKVVLTLINKADTTKVQTVSVIAGKADGYLHLHKGDTYLATLDFQEKHGDHYHSTDDIEKEKDHHFITFNPENANIVVLRAENDIVRKDGQRLGVKTEWTVNSVESTGKINIKLVHKPVTVDQNYPSATNQLGKTTGGEEDISVNIDAH